MNKKIYNSPEMEVVMIETLQLIAESIPVNENPANNEMESKFRFDFIDECDED